MASPDFPLPAFMDDDEIRMFADSVGKFLDRNAPPERIAGWREAGMVEREFWREAGEAGLLGVSVPESYGGPGGDFRHDVVVRNDHPKGVEALPPPANASSRLTSKPTAPRGRNSAGCPNWPSRAGGGDRDEEPGRLGPAIDPPTR